MGPAYYITDVPPCSTLLLSIPTFNYDLILSILTIQQTRAIPPPAVLGGEKYKPKYELLSKEELHEIYKSFLTPDLLCPSTSHATMEDYRKLTCRMLEQLRSQKDRADDLYRQIEEARDRAAAAGRESLETSEKLAKVLEEGLEAY